MNRVSLNSIEFCNEAGFSSANLWLNPPISFLNRKTRWNLDPIRFVSNLQGWIRICLNMLSQCTRIWSIYNFTNWSGIGSFLVVRIACKWQIGSRAWQLRAGTNLPFPQNGLLHLFWDSAEDSIVMIDSKFLIWLTSFLKWNWFWEDSDCLIVWRTMRH